MTVDRFVGDGRARWARLGALVQASGGRVERLSADDVAELGRLYRATTSDLAAARRDFPSDAATERLNDLVAAAHALVYSEAPTSGRRLRRFFGRDLPATVRANWRYTLVAFTVLLVPLVATFLIGTSSRSRRRMARSSCRRSCSRAARAFASPGRSCDPASAAGATRSASRAPRPSASCSSSRRRSGSPGSSRDSSRRRTRRSRSRSP